MLVADVVALDDDTDRYNVVSKLILPGMAII
jgi:hypothetical protein